MVVMHAVAVAGLRRCSGKTTLVKFGCFGCAGITFEAIGNPSLFDSTAFEGLPYFLTGPALSPEVMYLAYHQRQRV